MKKKGLLLCAVSFLVVVFGAGTSIAQSPSKLHSTANAVLLEAAFSTYLPPDSFNQT
jgi:hypothetical protein